MAYGDIRNSKIWLEMVDAEKCQLHQKHRSDPNGIASTWPRTAAASERRRWEYGWDSSEVKKIQLSFRRKAAG